MANLQQYRGKPVSIRRIRDYLAFDGIVEEVGAETVLVRLENPGTLLQPGDKCIFLMPDMTFIGVFESRRVQSFLSRLDLFQDRLDFSLLATFPSAASQEASAVAA